MRIHRLHARAYGVYDDHEFVFRPGLQVVYGPNEAGKSTLLELIRNLFFKIASQNHPFKFTSMSPELSALGELQDGRRFQVTRTTSPRNPVTGALLEVQSTDTGDEWHRNLTLLDKGGWLRQGVLASGQVKPFEQNAFLEMIGNVSESLYRRLFAFAERDLADLQEAEKEDDLKRMLFGGGVGGLAKFQQFEGTLKRQIDSLYKKQGKNQVLNRCLATAKAAEKAYLESRVSPQLYLDLKSRLKSLSEDRQQIRTALSNLRDKRSELEKLVAARPVWDDLENLRQRREEISLPVGATVEFAKSYRQLKGSLDQFVEDLRLIEEENDGLPQFVELTETEQRLLQRRVEVAELIAHRQRQEHDVASLQELVNRIETRRREADLLAVELGSALTTFDEEKESPVDDGQTVENRNRSRSITKMERQQARELREQFEAAIRGNELLIEKQRAIEQRRDASMRALNRQKQVSAIVVLEDLMHRLDSYVDESRDLKDLKFSVMKLEVEIETLRGALQRPFPVEIESVERLPTPLAATVVEFDQRMTLASERLRQTRERFQLRQEEFVNSKEKLATHDQLGTDESRVDLTDLRRRRDRGWLLLRQRFIDMADSAETEGLDEALREWADDSAKSPADRFEEMLSQGDRTADAQLANAEWIAKRHSLVEQIEVLEGKLADAANDVTEIELDIERLNAEWREIWQGCPFEPASPAAMREWINQRDELVDLLKQARQLSEQQHVLESPVRQFEQELERLFPEGTTADSRVKLLKKRHKDAEKLLSERERLNEEIEEMQRELDDISVQQQDAAVAIGELQSRLREFLRQVGLSDSLDARTCDTMIEQLQQFQRCREELQSEELRQSQLQQRIDHLNKEIAFCCRAVAEDLIGVDPIFALQELETRLVLATERDQHQREQQVAQAGIDRRRERLQGEIDRVATEIERLKSTLPDCNSLQSLEHLAEQVELMESLRTQEGQCRRELGHILNAELSTREAELTRSTISEFRAQMAEVEQEIQQTEETGRKTDEMIGVTERELQDMAVDDGASLAAQNLMSARAALREIIDQWAPLVLTQRLVTRSMKRFEERHQPELLRAVAVLFRQLTGGEYVDIRTLPSEANSLRLQHRSGNHKSPDQLSTGAQRMLFLAIRLAYVRDYCGRHEPLPMVLDDVLVHLDDGRARKALFALKEFETETQVILLTCHRRTLTLMSEIDPEFQPLDLTPSPDGRTRISLQDASMAGPKS
ncbi:MAG: AAA family ATPase [Planctomycetaceae bacterium]